MQYALLIGHKENEETMMTWKELATPSGPPRNRLRLHSSVLSTPLSVILSLPFIDILLLSIVLIFGLINDETDEGVVKAHPKCEK